MAVVSVLAVAFLLFALVSGALIRTERATDDGPTEPLPAVDPELITLSEELYRLDQQGNAAPITKVWTVNTRSTNGKLFTKFDLSSIKDKPTYASLIKLLDNYEPVLGKAETVTAAEKAEESAFLDAVIATPVMKKAWEYLKKKGVAPATTDGFKELLRKIWFTIYSRRGQPDTSGFEHTFVGEITSSAPDAQVTGFHNWVQYGLQEQLNRAQYERWKGQTDTDIYGLQFRWNKAPKIKSTIAIGESPEMSLAVMTTCFLVLPNTECQLRMGGTPINVITHKWTTRNPSEFYVASAYYDT